MKTFAAYYTLLLVVVAWMGSSSAFVPRINNAAALAKPIRVEMPLKMGLLDGGDERKALTRDNEPDQFFST